MCASVCVSVVCVRLLCGVVLVDDAGGFWAPATPPTEHQNNSEKGRRENTCTLTCRR